MTGFAELIHECRKRGIKINLKYYEIKASQQFNPSYRCAVLMQTTSGPGESSWFQSKIKLSCKSAHHHRKKDSKEEAVKIALSMVKGIPESQNVCFSTVIYDKSQDVTIRKFVGRYVNYNGDLSYMGL